MHYPIKCKSFQDKFLNLVISVLDLNLDIKILKFLQVLCIWSNFFKLLINDYFFVVNPMFQAMSTCSALHPDENQETDSEFEDVEEEEEEEGGGGG